MSKEQETYSTPAQIHQHLVEAAEEEKIEIKEKKKPEKIPISREEFVMDLYEAFEFWKKKGEMVGHELDNIRSLFDKLAISEQLGMRVDFFAEPETGKVEFIAREKGKFGYRGVVKNNEAPAQK